MIHSGRWSAIRRGRGDLPPVVGGLGFFGDLDSPNTSIISGAVAQLGDSSGNGRHFPQAAAGSRPAYAATDALLGGRPSMTFDGISKFLSLTTNFASAGLTLLCAFRPTTVAAADQRIFGVRVGATADSPLLSMSTVVVQALMSNPNATYTIRTSSTLTANTTYRAATTFDVSASLSAKVPSLYVDGATTATYAATSANAGTVSPSAAYAIGGTDLGTSLFSGIIVDPLIYTRILSAAEITQVDDWIKWRNSL